MTRKISLAFTIIGIAALVGIIATFSLRVYFERSHNLTKTEESFQELSSTAVSSYLARGSFTAPYFMRRMKSFFSDHPSVTGVVVYTAEGAEYVYARNSETIGFNPDADDEWIGAPVFTIRPFFEHVESSSLTVPTREGVYIASVHTIMSREKFFLILRDSIIAVSSLFLLIIIFLAVTPSDKKKQQPVYAPAPHQAETSASGLETPPADTDASTSQSSETADTVKGLFSAKTGLGWEEYLESRLSFELRRAASYDQDLVLILLKDPQLRNDQDRYLAVAQQLLKQFTFQDMLFEYKNDGYAVILPNIELDPAMREVEQFYKTVCASRSTKCNLNSGLSSRNGRLINGNRLIAEAARALSKAITEPQTPIIAFRSDPEKYRQFIASNM
jgi:hypothetical protein